jgi:hypothetical protein
MWPTAQVKWSGAPCGPVRCRHTGYPQRIVPGRQARLPEAHGHPCLQGHPCRGCHQTVPPIHPVSVQQRVVPTSQSCAGAWQFRQACQPPPTQITPSPPSSSPRHAGRRCCAPWGNFLHDHNSIAVLLPAVPTPSVDITQTSRPGMGSAACHQPRWTCPVRLTPCVENPKKKSSPPDHDHPRTRDLP